jgi:hypothetical protein
MTGRDHGRAADNKVEIHRSIVACGYRTGAVTGSGIPLPRFLTMPRYVTDLAALVMVLK